LGLKSRFQPGESPSRLTVIPAKAGIHRQCEAWIPAFAGMTVREYRLFQSRWPFRALPHPLYDQREILRKLSQGSEQMTGSCDHCRMPSTHASTEDTTRGPRGPLALLLLALFGLCLFVGFIELGNWQVRRLAWKRDLITRVDQRVHASPIAPPTPDQWSKVNAEADEYRHVQVTGKFLHDRQTLIWAASDEGSGYFVVTPLQLADGSIVLVNRGFAPEGWCGRDGQCAPGPSGPVTVTGLLRMSEPSGLFRHNDPAHNSWYTRDVPAIAAARGLTHAAPYFIDQDAMQGASADAWPKGGTTVINFPNNHLSYLITWYLMALLTLAAGSYVGYDEYKLRRASKQT
jgi:surfeit locus 1 family protein